MYCIPKDSEETRHPDVSFKTTENNHVGVLLSKQFIRNEIPKVLRTHFCSLVEVRHYRKHTYHLVQAPLSTIPSLMGMVCEPNRG